MSQAPQPSRAEMAAKIMEKPAGYKVCEGCGSIVLKKASVCPNCNTYRFDENPEAVIAQAKDLANRDPISIDKNDYN